MKELYFSFDVETDGPIPGPHSMLSLGCVVFDEDGKELDAFSTNLHTLDGASAHPETAHWWSTQPEAWVACRESPLNPSIAMTDFAKWVGLIAENHGGKPVAVAYPAGFDWTFLYWYLIKFAGRSPFGFQCLDMKTYASAILQKPFRNTSKKTMPSGWFEDLPPHTHLAVDDAREQGQLFIRMLKHGRGR